MNRKYFVLAVLVVALLSGALAVSAQDMVDRDSVGGRLVISDSFSDVPLDPFVSSWHSTPHYAIYATLFDKAENLEYVGYLADSWEFAEDGLSLTINLIDHASFSDGTPVNAEAIKWNLDRYSDGVSSISQGRSLVGLVTSIEVLSEFTLRLDLSRSAAPLVFWMAGLEIVSPHGL